MQMTDVGGVREGSQILTKEVTPRARVVNHQPVTFARFLRFDQRVAVYLVRLELHLPFFLATALMSLDRQLGIII